MKQNGQLTPFVATYKSFGQKLNSPKRRRDLGSKKKSKRNEHSHETAEQIVDLISITF